MGMLPQGAWVGDKKKQGLPARALCQAGYHCEQVGLGTSRWGKRGAFIQWLLWSSLTKRGPKGEKRLQLWQGAIWLSCATPVTQLWLRYSCPGGQEVHRVQWGESSRITSQHVKSGAPQPGQALQLDFWIFWIYTDSLKNRLKKNHACLWQTCDKLNQSINRLNCLT